MFCSVSPDVASVRAQCRPATADSSPLCLAQCAEKKAEASGPEVEPCPELHVEALEALTRVSAGPEGGGVRPEQPFLVLEQEEYGEHHSSIMHCRWVRVGGEAQPGKMLTGGWPSLQEAACEGAPGWTCRKWAGPQGTMVTSRDRGGLPLGSGDEYCSELLLAPLASLSFQPWDSELSFSNTYLLFELPKTHSILICFMLVLLGQYLPLTGFYFLMLKTWPFMKKPSRSSVQGAVGLRSRRAGGSQSADCKCRRSRPSV